MAGNRHNMDMAITFDPALALARQALYRFASLALLDPVADPWSRLDGLRTDPVLDHAAALVRSACAGRPGTLGPGEKPLDLLDPHRVMARLPASADALYQAHTNFFGLLAATSCPPCETEYIESKLTFQRSNALADVAGFYRAFGLAPSRTQPQRWDHAVLELEFMAVVIGLQRLAATDGQPSDTSTRQQRVEVCLAAQRRFLSEHLAWWLPAFARLLGREAHGTFYEPVAEFLAALIPAERILLEIPVQNRHAQPSPIELPDMCQGCQLAT